MHDKIPKTIHFRQTPSICGIWEQSMYYCRMNKWHTILSQDLPMEIHLAESILLDNNIACTITDELTAQVAPYSAAIGGIKLKVKGKDFITATKILQNAGMLSEQDLTPSKAIVRLDELTNNLPFIGKMLFIKRLFTIAIFICVLILMSVSAFVL